MLVCRPHSGGMGGIMVKFICTDVDGTLVPDGGHDLNPEYFSQIRRLKKMGILFAAVSGRSYSSLEKLFAPVIQDILFICDNGARTIFQNNLIACHTIRRDLADEITRDIEAILGCTTYISGVKSGYVKKDAHELYQWLTDGYQLDITQVDRMPEDIPAGERILGVEMYHPTAAEELANQGLYQKWHGHRELQVVCSGRQWMNFTPLSADKGIAVSEYQNRHGIQPADTMAFGDNLNDAGMLLRADQSYAIGNARKEIKGLARFVTDTNVNDGVLQVLKTIK